MKTTADTFTVRKPALLQPKSQTYEKHKLFNVLKVFINVVVFLGGFYLLNKQICTMKTQE